MLRAVAVDLEAVGPASYVQGFSPISRPNSGSKLPRKLVRIVPSQSYERHAGLSVAYP